MPRSKAEIEFLADFANQSEHFWIGSQTFTVSEPTHFLDGSKIGQIQWALGQPVKYHECGGVAMLTSVRKQQGKRQHMI